MIVTDRIPFTISLPVRTRCGIPYKIVRPSPTSEFDGVAWEGQVQESMGQWINARWMANGLHYPANVFGLLHMHPYDLINKPIEALEGYAPIRRGEIYETAAEARQQPGGIISVKRGIYIVGEIDE